MRAASQQWSSRQLRNSQASRCFASVTLAQKIWVRLQFVHLDDECLVRVLKKIELAPKIAVLDECFVLFKKRISSKKTVLVSGAIRRFFARSVSHVEPPSAPKETSKPLFRLSDLAAKDQGKLAVCSPTMYLDECFVGVF